MWQAQGPALQQAKRRMCPLDALAIATMVHHTHTSTQLILVEGAGTQFLDFSCIRKPERAVQLTPLTKAPPKSGEHAKTSVDLTTGTTLQMQQ